MFCFHFSILNDYGNLRKINLYPSPTKKLTRKRAPFQTRIKPAGFLHGGICRGNENGAESGAGKGFTNDRDYYYL